MFYRKISSHCFYSDFELEKKIGNEEDEGGDKEKVEVQPKRKTSN